MNEITFLNANLIAKEMESLPGYIIGGPNLNNIIYADDSALIADTERKLKNLFEKTENQSKKEGLSTDYTKTECVIISKKMRFTGREH